MVKVFFGKAERDDNLYARLELCVTESDMSLWTWLQQGKMKANAVGTHIK